MCGKAFRTSGHLKNHETSHFKDPERPRRITGPRLSKADALPTLPDIELPVCMNKSVISGCLSSVGSGTKFIVSLQIVISKSSDKL